MLEDLGDGPSLADALLGDSADTACTRLNGWVDAIATVHAATAGAVPSHDSLVDSTPRLLARAADRLETQLPELGLSPGPAALAQLRSASAGLSGESDALTPADACPDNNVATSSGLVLLDFEQATVRPAVWDAAYLIVPWPSCWCSWGLPAEVAGAALSRWRTAVAPSIPAVGGPGFDRDLDIAVICWSFVSVAWFLAGALEEGEQTSPGGEVGSPSRRAVIQHRMQLAAQRSVRPALAALAGDVLAATTHRWGNARLDDAPAYRYREPTS